MLWTHPASLPDTKFKPHWSRIFVVDQTHSNPLIWTIFYPRVILMVNFYVSIDHIKVFEKYFCKNSGRKRVRRREEEKSCVTPWVHCLAKRGSWVLPLKPPKTEATTLRPLNSSIGCRGSILGLGCIPNITVVPHPFKKIKCFKVTLRRYRIKYQNDLLWRPTYN